MKTLCTIEQQEELAKLCNEGHSGALVAFGADMYRDGIINGALTVGVGVLVGLSCALIKLSICRRKNKEPKQ